MLIRLFFLFISAVPFSIYAYELLSSKTTVSPGCEGGVLEYGAESYFLVSNDYANGLSASTGARAFSATGHIGELIKLHSTHSFSVQNHTNKSQVVKVNLKLSTHDGKNTSSEDTYRLAPLESMYETTSLYLNTQYKVSGVYKVYAQTILSGKVHSTETNSNGVLIQ
jgi:hypothetical protein